MTSLPRPSANASAAVSVVIPTHNRRDLLLRTLHSVLRQRHIDISIIVVDDASTDGSADTVRALEDPRVRVIRHPVCRGVSQARNTGIEQVDTDWVAFVDDDDLWSPDKVRAQLDALQRCPEAQWACSGAVHIDSACRVLFPAPPPDDSDISGLILGANIIPGGGSGVLAATSLTRQVGGFDVALANLADWDFYIRLGLRSPVAAAPGPLVGYHAHVGGMAHDVARSERDFKYMKAKYADERQARNVEPNMANWLAYLAGLAYNGGHRMMGARLHLQAARHGRLRSLRSVATAFLPEHVRVARSRRWLLRLPAERPEECAWLAVYADGCWRQAAGEPADATGG
jgi:glycosyltransferase involved in cell wall biosynthesis